MTYPMTAYEQGQMAKHDGMSIDVNPYTCYQTHLHCQWALGWFHGGWQKAIDAGTTVYQRGHYAL